MRISDWSSDVCSSDLLTVPVSRRAGAILLALCLALLVLLPLLRAGLPLSEGVARFDAFYRSGALVFGGGHVILPLLEAEAGHPGRVSQDEFLAGYGAAQAGPGTGEGACRGRVG